MMIYGTISGIVVWLLWAIILYFAYELIIFTVLVLYMWNLAKPLGYLSYDSVEKILILAKKLCLPHILKKFKKNLNEYTSSVDGRTIS